MRWWNERDWAAYRQHLLAGRSPEEGREHIDATTQALEATWLGLRTSAGLALDGRPEAVRELVRLWEREGLAVLEGGRVRLTAQGWLLLDRLAVELDSRGASPVASLAG